jgi:hypothetical protein
MQLLNDNLLPLSSLDPVFCCIRSKKIILELMDDYLRPRLYFVRGLVQEVNCQLLELFFAEVTQSFEELTMKLEPWAEVKTFTFIELFQCVWIDELAIAMGCYELSPQIEDFVKGRNYGHLILHGRQLCHVLPGPFLDISEARYNGFLKSLHSERS